jgi:hypothetical protein
LIQATGTYIFLFINLDSHTSDNYHLFGHNHLVFTNVPVDMAVEGAETPLLKLNRHHKAYEIEIYCLFSSRGVDQCVDLFYETVWSCFERHVRTICAWL